MISLSASDVVDWATPVFDGTAIVIGMYVESACIDLYHCLTAVCAAEEASRRAC